MKQSEFEKTKLNNRLTDYMGRSHLEESSEEVLRRAVKWFVELHGDIEPALVRYGHADDYRSWLKKGRAGSSANTYLAMIGGLFKWLLRRGYIGSDPFDGVKRFKVAERKFDIYTPEEIRRIIKVADDRWRAVVCLGLCSMRRAEIQNLLVSDIDFASNEIHIKPKKLSETTWPWQIKNHNEALVGIEDSIAQMLMKLIDSLTGSRQPYVILRPKYWKRNLVRQKEGTLSHRDRNLPWGNFNREFKALLRRARVPDKRFHDLRGTFATVNYRDGLELIDLQYLMRHSSIQTTARYVKKEEERKLLKKSGRTFKKYYVSNVP